MLRSAANSKLVSKLLLFRVGRLDSTKLSCALFSKVTQSHTKSRLSQLTPAGLLTNVNCRPIHTTQRLCVTPFLWLLMRPLAKVVAVLGGRKFRTWWRSLNTEQRKKVWSRYGGVFYASLFGLLGAFGYYYYLHVQEAPYTKRKRFVAFTDEQFRKIVEYEKDAVLQQLHNRFLPPDHPFTESVVKVTRKLTEANADVEAMPSLWTIGVVNEPLNDNAFCLPTGHVIVYSGLIETIENEEQLAAVLAHEMAHVVLSHSAEKVSFTQLLDYAIIVVMAAIWAVMPGDGIAIVTQWFFNKVMHIFVELPYSRTLEREADQVGLMLMAKACFDVREFSRFWQILHQKQLLVLEARSDSKLQASTATAAPSPPSTSLHQLQNTTNRDRPLQRTEILDKRSVSKFGSNEAALHHPRSPTNAQSFNSVSACDSLPVHHNTRQFESLLPMSNRGDFENRHMFTLQLEELFNTHPAHYRREEYLNELMPDAIALRRSRKCCELSGSDPRERPIKMATLRERIAPKSQQDSNLVVIGRSEALSPDRDVDIEYKK